MCGGTRGTDNYAMSHDSNSVNEFLNVDYFT